MLKTKRGGLEETPIMHYQDSEKLMVAVRATVILAMEFDHVNEIWDYGRFSAWKLSSLRFTVL